MLIAYKGVETGDSRIYIYIYIYLLYMNENGMKIASIIKNNFWTHKNKYTCQVF